MAQNFTFRELAEEVLRTAPSPLTPEEIWTEAKRTGLWLRVQLLGKRPELTLSAYLYTFSSGFGPFLKTADKPARFWLSARPLPPKRVKDIVPSAESPESTASSRKDSLNAARNALLSNDLVIIMDAERRLPATGIKAGRLRRGLLDRARDLKAKTVLNPIDDVACGSSLADERAYPGASPQPITTVQSDGIQTSFGSAPLDSDAAFTYVLRGAGLLIRLNNEHPVYTMLSDALTAPAAATEGALRIMLEAWVRVESASPPPQQERIRRIREDWGRMMALLLDDDRQLERK